MEHNSVSQFLIDFHIIHHKEPDSWVQQKIDHIESHGHKCHVIAGADNGDLIPVRIKGYRQGKNEYVSFVDPDDEIDLSQLPTNVEHEAWYTNSYQKGKRSIKPFYKHTKWTWNWHIKRRTPIHQIAVIKRSIVDKAIADLEQQQLLFDQRLILPDQQIFNFVTKYTTWKFFADSFPYTWYNDGSRQQRHHRQFSNIKGNMQYISNQRNNHRPLWLK